MRAILRIRPDGIHKERHLTSWHLKATQRAHARFLLNTMKKIRFRRHRGYEEYYRDLARSNKLMIPLERALLIYNIPISSLLFGLQPLLIFWSPIHEFAELFNRSFVFLGLNLLRYYNSCDALRLLAKDEADMLKPFSRLYESARSPS